jgi:DNA-binding transcriptional LysR family regulator
MNSYRSMERLTVRFDALPLARWGPLFQVLRLEHPGLRLEWKEASFPTADRSILEGADVGLLVAPPQEMGLDVVTLETSPMVVIAAVGHHLADHDTLSVADVLEEPFPGGRNHHPEWRAFWTLDEYRGGPPRVTDDDVEGPGESLDVVVSGRAIATLTAPLASALPHPGIVTIRLTDGPPVATRLVWRTEESRPVVRSLVGIARDMVRDPSSVSTERGRPRSQGRPTSSLRRRSSRANYPGPAPPAGGRARR